MSRKPFNELYPEKVHYKPDGADWPLCHTSARVKTTTHSREVTCNSCKKRLARKNNQVKALLRKGQPAAKTEEGKNGH